MNRILIIDDDPDMRTVLNILLKQHGYEVEMASHRQEAFQKLEEFKPEIILLDVLLSGSDGRDICKRIKGNENTKNVLVIMLSAHPGAAENINNYGADDFISKPFDSDFLLNRVGKQLEQARQ